MNAAKHTPVEGRVALTLLRDGQTAEIRVCDDGTGISADMLEPIFELFVQSEGTVDGSGGGMGAGLTLVKHLVELQGGSVTAESDGTNRGNGFRERQRRAYP